jgi:hypothetical protein
MSLEPIMQTHSRMNVNRGRFVLSRAALLSLAGVLSASPAALAQPRTQVSQEREGTAAGGDQSGGWNVSLTPSYEHVFDTDLRSSQGSIQINRAGAELEFGGRLGSRARWGLTTSYEVSWYNFNNTPDLIPSGENPFQEVHMLRFTPTLAYSIDQQWSVLGGAIVQFAGERDADIGDSATYGGFVAANYAISDKLSLSFGVRAATQLESDASVFPFVGVTWAINDTLTLRTRGPRVELAAKASEHLTARIFGAYDSREYRLSDDSAIPDGVVRDRRGRVGFGLDWSACSAATITLEAGVDVYQRFFFDDENGERVGADRTKPAPFIGLRGELRF